MYMRDVKNKIILGFVVRVTGDQTIIFRIVVLLF